MASTSAHFLNIESFVQSLDNQQLWNDLKHVKDPDKQINAAKRFKSLLVSFSTSISTEKEWHYILTSIDEKMKKYLFSDFPHEIIGGILLISELIQLITNVVSLSNNINNKQHNMRENGGDNKDILQEFFSRYATYLEEVLKKCHTHDDRFKSNTISVIALCTQTLGNLVPFAGNNIAKRTVETDIKQALKWISSSYNKQVHYQHKIAAVWILCEYAISIPILFNVHINEIIITIVNAIRDKNELVRIGGCKVLKECLKLISKRPHREQTSLSSRITTDAYQGLLNYHSSNIGVKHGSLLTFQCVLNYCINNDERIVKIDFKQLCELVLKSKDSRKPIIKLSVIKLLPLFAAYETSKFIKLTFLDQSLSFLIKLLSETNSKSVHSNTKSQTKDFRDQAFKSIGKIALIVGPKMIHSTKSEIARRKAFETLGKMLQSAKNQSQLQKILFYMQESFDLAYDRKKQNRSYKPYIKYPLKCLSMLANALNNELALFLDHQLILTIFNLGLTNEILKCIQNIYINVIQYQPLIQDRLSRMVWMILLYNTSIKLSHPDVTSSSSSSSSSSDTNNNSNSDEDDIDESKHIDDEDGYSERNGYHHHNGHSNPNINNDDIDDGFNNIMYYHYKNNNVYYFQATKDVIDNNEYYMATNKYYKTSRDEQTKSSINGNHNANNKYDTDIPPFVSPPISVTPSRYYKHHHHDDNHLNPNSNIPNLGPRKQTDEYYGDYYYESSVGSGLNSPISTIIGGNNTPNRFNDSQTRRRSSINREQQRYREQQQRYQESRNKNVINNITEFEDKELRNPKLIELALETMSKFNLHDVNINLLYFIRETILFYCNHQNVSIRKQAGITCCILLTRIIQQMDKEEQHLKQHWIEMNNTHSNKLQQQQQQLHTNNNNSNNSNHNNNKDQHLKPGLISVTSIGSNTSNDNNIKLPPKSLTSTPNNNYMPSPLWVLSGESQPTTPNIYKSTQQQQPTSIHIPSNMYNSLKGIAEEQQFEFAKLNDLLQQQQNILQQCHGYHMQLSGQHKHESSIICNILAKLLSLAIADIEIEVREQLLLSLLENESFYKYLARQELLPSLFIALNDEYFGVREIALKLLGILATYNPAHIMPFIRKNLLELLTYLDNRLFVEKQDISNRQQSAELIGDLIEFASQETMKPYVNRIMIVLLRQLKLGDNINVEISILRTIGKLAKVAPQTVLKQYFNKFIPILVSILNETSDAIYSNNKKFINNDDIYLSHHKKINTIDIDDNNNNINNNNNNTTLIDTSLINKKCVTLQSLGHIIESTGLVIQPYLLYKKLLKIILDSLKNDQHLIIRREAIQLLGIIGALDPFIHKQNLKQLKFQQQIQKKFDKNQDKLSNLKASNDDNKDDNNNNNKNNKPTAKPNLSLYQDEFYDEEESDFLSESNILLITGSRDPQFYAYVALRSLILIVHNESLHEYHRESLLNISKIFSTLGSECIPYLQNVIPPILENLKKFNNASQRAMLLQQLSKLINIVKSHIRTYLNKIFELIHNLWDQNTYILIMMNAIRYNTSATTKKLNNNKNNNSDNNKNNQTGKDNVDNMNNNNNNKNNDKQQIQQKQTQLNVYNGYHPYYNHPSSNIASVPVINDNRMNQTNIDSINVNLFQHIRNRSDSFGPFGGAFYQSSIINYPSMNQFNNIPSTMFGNNINNSNSNEEIKQQQQQQQQQQLQYNHNGGNIDYSETNIKTHYELQDQLLSVMIEICHAIQDEFKQYLHRLLPKLLIVLRRENYINKSINEKSINERSIISALHALTIFGNNLQDFLFLVLPPIMELIQSPNTSLLIKIHSIECIGRLSTKCNFNAYTSRIIHPLIHIINNNASKIDHSLFNITMGTLCLMMIKMGQDFLIFASMINRTLSKCRKSHSHYSNLLNRLQIQGLYFSDNNLNKLTNQLFDDKHIPIIRSSKHNNNNNIFDKIDDNDNNNNNDLHHPFMNTVLSSSDIGIDNNDATNNRDDNKDNLDNLDDAEKLKVAEVMLKKAWDITGRAAERDWFAWLHGFQVELLSQNPRRELRVCSSLAQKYKGLANDLFNAAFLSCWLELNDKFQHECRRSLMSALQKTKLVPAKVKKILLHLVEFMERQNHSLWIDIPVLANVAELSHSYPNALYYKEKEFRLSCLVISPSSASRRHHHHHHHHNNHHYNKSLMKRHYHQNHHSHHHSNNIDQYVINEKFNQSYSITAESILKINNQLQETEAAEGILQYTQMHKPQINIKPTWFEKLNRWEEALDAYSKLHLECQPNDLNANITASLGRMRCLEALGEWDRLFKLATDSFSDIRLELDRLNNSNRLHKMLNINNNNNNNISSPQSEDELSSHSLNSLNSMNGDSRNNIKSGTAQRQRSGFNAKIARIQKEKKNASRRIKSSETKKDTESILLQFERDVAPLGAIACWNLGLWDKMKNFVKKINSNNNFQGAFLRSILSVHDNDKDEALFWIEKCREFLDLKFTSIIVDDYENIYPLCVKAQQLVELEEILLYKDAKLHNNIEKCNQLKSMWKHRLNFVQNSVEVWQSILSIRQLVISPKDDVDTWLKFTSLCRKSNRLSMSLKIIANLMGYQNEDILFYHQMYYSNDSFVVDKRQHLNLTKNNFVKWAPSLKRSGSASQLHNHMNDTLTFPLGVKRVRDKDISLFSLFMRSQDSYTNNNNNQNNHTMQHFMSNDDDEMISPLTNNTNNNNNNRLDVDSATTTTTFKFFDEYKSNDDDDELVHNNNYDEMIYKDAQPNVAFAYAKHLWSAGLKNQALAQLQGLVTFMENFIEYYESENSDNIDQEKYYYYHHLTASCYLRLGRLKYEKNDNEYLKDNDIDQVLTCYKNATKHDPTSFYAWHAWALMNYQAIQYYEDKIRSKKKREKRKSKNKNKDKDKDKEKDKDKDKNKSQKKFVIDKDNKLYTIVPAAVDALFKSIIFGQNLKLFNKMQYNSISTSDTKLQDVLRLLRLWFAYGDQNRVTIALQRGFDSISIDIWLSVIPQIIARLHIPNTKIRSLIHGLLVKVGKTHPQSLIFPLTVASKSPNITRKKSAKSLLDKIRYYNPSLVEQGEMVSKELLRVAILWHEMWYEGLIEASKLFWDKSRNVNAMVARLKPLYDLLLTNNNNNNNIKKINDKNNEKKINDDNDDNDDDDDNDKENDKEIANKRTLREQAFEDAFKFDLLAAWELVKQYQKTKNERDMLQAWDYYRRVYNKIDQQFDKLRDLDLQYVSPWLKNAHNLKVIMPGTYNSNNIHNNNDIYIYKFNSSLSVLDTAQRPRKLTILGSDGNNYTFLLKGREDLRQDERVMQLFGLINRLLSSSNETCKRDLEIRTYAVIPLAPNCGMIGWVSFTDTIHSLIETYRESQQLIFGIEHEFVKEESMLYDNLPMYNKLEIFKYVLNITKGNDLRDLFWLKSWSSEIWLKKRCEYMRSLGVMSMVGYILGLGDRHPCNLMIHRYTGKVVHIDFGDCFEVAMLRDKLPEKVPFRLTRMLINAMEISGFEGNFRITCQSVMHLLREHKQSVMAVLEALAYDPLMNWRLLEQQEQEQEKEKEKEREREEKEKKEKKQQQHDKKENGHDLKLETSSSSSSATSSINQSPLSINGGTPTSIADSTTNFTPELNLSNGNAVVLNESAGVAVIDDDIINDQQQISTKQSVKRKRVTFQQKSSRNDNKLEPQHQHQQIHQLYAISLQSKKSKSLASSLREDEYDDSSDNNSGSTYNNTKQQSRRQRVSSLWMPRELELDTDSTENINKKALQVLQRVSTKLRGRDYNDNNNKNIHNNNNRRNNTKIDFGLMNENNINDNNEENEVTNVKEQVQRLFIEATHHENLSQAYLGWCPLW